ncbi:S24 family peptidase [Sphingobium baderi]|nr:helix-turn-helix transcriptional regulator [Sphingobium baderi]
MGTVEDDIQMIRDLIEWSGETAAAIARNIGSANTTINRFKKGTAETRLGRQTLTKLKEAYPKFPGFVDADSGERPNDGEDSDDVDIQQWNVAYGMGGGTYLDIPVTGEMHKFSRSWLRQFTNAPPEKIFLATGTGDSMTPTILDSDIVLIDTSENQIRVGDKIWAVAYGETGLIKRLRRMADGSVKMLSDNPVVDPETAYDGELTVVGRVVAVVRKM